MVLAAVRPTSTLPPAPDPDRYRRLAVDLRAAAAECQALSASIGMSIPAKCSSDIARSLRQTASVADRAYWLFSDDIRHTPLGRLGGRNVSSSLRRAVMSAKGQGKRIQNFLPKSERLLPSPLS